MAVEYNQETYATDRNQYFQDRIGLLSSLPGAVAGMGAAEERVARYGSMATDTGDPVAIAASQTGPGELTGAKRKVLQLVQARLSPGIRNEDIEAWINDKSTEWITDRVKDSLNVTEVRDIYLDPLKDYSRNDVRYLIDAFKDDKLSATALASLYKQVRDKLGEVTEYEELVRDLSGEITPERAIELRKEMFDRSMVRLGIRDSTAGEMKGIWYPAFESIYNHPESGEFRAARHFGKEYGIITATRMSEEIAEDPEQWINLLGAKVDATVDDRDKPLETIALASSWDESYAQGSKNALVAAQKFAEIKDTADQEVLDVLEDLI